MKILKTLSAALAVMMFASCSDEVFDAPVMRPVEEASPVDNINANTAAIRAFVEAKEAGLSVAGTRQTESGAYVVEFGDGSSVALNTQMGSLEGSPNGQPTPTVAAQKDEDGQYYWTVDGEWLKTDAGEKIRVTGARAVTPKLSVTPSGEWSMNLLDYGTRTLGAVKEGVQTSSIASVDITDPSSVIVYFSNATEPLILGAEKNPDNPDTPLTGSLRRPIDASHPAWLIHIDCWNYADPAKIIDLIPKDILPYVIFNLSLSVSHDENTGRFNVSEYGYELVKSWLRTCAERNVWAMVQPSSGGYCHLPDVSSYSQFDNDPSCAVYREFFQYPNFLGFNYCEQFWGFDSRDALGSPSWLERVAHWNELLKLTHEYGGYLVVSFCGNQWSGDINPVATIKRNPAFAATTAMYQENFIYCEKYTQSSMFFDVEAGSMGVWLSGHAGNYGCRFDQCAWNETAANYYGLGTNETDFPVALGNALVMEHTALTGQTVFDGPEIIWYQDFKEAGLVDAGDGYQSRSWTTFDQFRNIYFDLYRKIIDGTIRLMTRDEVIDRCKYAVVQDITSGSSLDQYCLPVDFFTGIGALDHDGGRENNHFYLRKTGRYPAIPVVAEFANGMSSKFETIRNQSEILNTWSTTSNKLRELNRVFPQEYTGDLFAGRNENTWVTYNPWKDTKSANIPFKYNTCESMDLTFETFACALFREYSDKVTCYLNKYQTDGKKTKSVITINGASARPSVNVVARADASVSHTEEWADGKYTLTVTHNGPVDISFNCSGSATGRLTEYTPSSIQVPANPMLYNGARQSEAEVWDFKNVGQRITQGYPEPIRLYTGQGYIRMGNSSSAAVRDELYFNEAGHYYVKFRYRAETADVTAFDLYVNGQKIVAPTFTQSGSDKSLWLTTSTPVSLKEGWNTFELKASRTPECDLYLDNIIVEPM